MIGIESATAVAEIARNARPPDNAMDITSIAVKPIPVGGSMSSVTATAGINIRLSGPGPAEVGRLINFTA